MMRNMPFWKSSQPQPRKRRRRIARSARRSAPLTLYLGVEKLEDRRMLAAGDPDLTFNAGNPLDTDGIVTHALNFVEATQFGGARAVAQSNGMIVVAGTGQITISSATRVYSVARFFPDGSLDTDFGVGGVVTIDFDSSSNNIPTGSSSAHEAFDLAIDSSGRIIVVGTSSHAVGSIFESGIGIARLTASGQLDTSFDFDGKQFTIDSDLNPASEYLGTSVALQNDGTIVVGGIARTDTATGDDFLLARYDSSGNLLGIVTTDFTGGDDLVNDAAIQSDGKIVLAGRTDVLPGTAFAVARYDDSGGPLVLDAGFGVGGKATIDIIAATTESIEAFAVAIDETSANRKIVLAGHASNISSLSFVAMARLTDAGVLDATFTDNGAVAGVRLPGSTAYNVPNESVATTDQTNLDSAFALTVQPDGNYVIAGSVRNSSGTSNPRVFLGRVLGNPLSLQGRLDTSFSGDGFVIANAAPGTLRERFADVLLQPDGKILLAGQANATNVMLARYESGLILPTADAGGPYAINEPGGSLVLDGTGSTDPINPGTLVYHWDLDGDGIFGEAGAGAMRGDEVGQTPTFTASAVDGDSAIPISLRVTNQNGFFDIETVMVDIVNVAPTLVLSGAASVDEGASYTLNLSSSDPGSDVIFEWIIDWGDGDVETVTGNPSSWNHVYADGANNYVISAMASDEDGTFVAGNTVAVAVSNVAPTLAISGAASVNEGASYTLNLSSFDPGADTITGWTINWGDGNIEPVSGNPVMWNHVYADGANNYTISATATDEDGTFSAGNTVAIAVNNVAPFLAISGAANVNEGASYTLNLSSFDPGSDTITSWTINWGDGNIEPVSGNPATWNHIYADGANNYTISATATDDDGTFAAGNTVVVGVDNVAPFLAISGAANVNEAASYTLNLSFSDPGSDTIASWTINWGDGTQTISGNPSSVAHVYADGSASYVISATATDEDGTFAASNTVSVTVDNVAPSADAGGPYFTFDDTTITLSGSGFDVAGAADPLSFEWDLDGDNIFGETGAGATRGDELGATPVFNPNGVSGTHVVTLRVKDGDGGLATDTANIDVLGEGTVLIDGVLHIVGSSTANDTVIITQTGGNISVTASTQNGDGQFNVADVDEIRVRLRNGHDIVVTSPSVIVPMFIDGGGGNDLLAGGSGADVILGGTGHDALYGGAGDDQLLGGDGNDDLLGGGGNDALVGGGGFDILFGELGRDLLIGGHNSDLLSAGSGEDILVGGYTIHDNDLDALDQIMAVWGSPQSFDDRVDSLTESGGLLEPASAVFDDDAIDVVLGGAGRDLVFGDTNPWDGSIDLIALDPFQDELMAVN